ncbi:MAG: hypothetical protein ACOYW4_01405 [Bacillota bacterium]
MTPREERGQANHRSEASEKGLALEAAIRRIKGVASVKVSCGRAGEVTGINVLIGKGAGSKRIIRDVESACMAHLGHRLGAGALSVTRVPGGSEKRKAASGGAQPASSGVPQPSSGRPGAQSTDASSPEGHSGVEPGADADSEGLGGKRLAVRKYRVISRSGVTAGGKAGYPEPDRRQKGDGEDPRSEPRIGVRQVGINVYPNRIHAAVELACAGRTFTGEHDGIPTDENRFNVPVSAALKALDQAFGGLVGVSVDDVQLCRLSGRKTAVVLATIGAPWGDVPSTGASYATRSEEEAVIRALLHAVNRCVTLTYGGEEL